MSNYAMPLEGEVLPDIASPPSPTQSAPDYSKSGYVNNGSIVAFTDGLSTQCKEDALNALLFAQLYADQKHDRFKDPVKWYEFFHYTLGKIGGRFDEQIDLNKHLKAGTYKISETIVSIIRSLRSVSDSEVQTMTSTLGSLQKLPASDSPVKTFNGQAEKSKEGNFQVCICEDFSRDTFTMTLGVAYFKAKKDLHRFLWPIVDNHSVDLFVGAAKIRFDLSVYATVRDTIKTKLGKRINMYVWELK